MRNPFGWFLPQRGTGQMARPRAEGSVLQAEAPRPGVPELLCPRPESARPLSPTSVPLEALPGGRLLRLAAPCPVSATAWPDRAPRAAWLLPSFSRVTRSGKRTGLRPRRRHSLLQAWAWASSPGASVMQTGLLPLWGLGALLAPRAELAGPAHLTPRTGERPPLDVPQLLLWTFSSPGGRAPGAERAQSEGACMLTVSPVACCFLTRCSLWSWPHSQLRPC